MVFELTKYAAREDNLLDQSFVQFMRMITKITVIAVGVIYLLRAISGKPLSALLAGLGIGGLAVALAAQESPSPMKRWPAKASKISVGGP
jgi:small-conductance mechanosensitive channel